jgi:hypothetical protein
MLRLSVDCRQESRLWNNSSLVNHLFSYKFYSFINTREGEVSNEVPLQVNTTKPGYCESGFGYTLDVGTIAEIEASKAPLDGCFSLRCMEIGERWTGRQITSFWAKFQCSKFNSRVWIVGDLKVFGPDRTKMNFVVGKEYLGCIHKGYQIDSPNR